MPPLGQSSSKSTNVVLVYTYVHGVKRKRRFAALHAVPAVREAVTLDYCKVSGIYIPSTAPVVRYRSANTQKTLSWEKERLLFFLVELYER